MIQIQDKHFEPYINSYSIKKVTLRIVEELNNSNISNPLFIIVLNGAFMFASDLIKNYNGDCTISFIKLASYEGTKSTGKVREIIGLDNKEVFNRNVIIIEDIVDTGNSMEFLLNEFKKHKPLSVKIVSLLFKEEVFDKNFLVDYVGIKIPNIFILGYGLDYDGYGRNLKEIYKIIE